MLTTAAALAAPLRQFTGWRLMVFCAHCRVLVRLEVARLVARQGDKLVGDVVQRLRCSRCGTLPASVKLADGTHGEGRAGFQEVDLMPAAS